jgi:hypothetical protein
MTVKVEIDVRLATVTSTTGSSSLNYSPAALMGI